MKKALAMLIAVLFSVGAGIEFILPKSDEFMLSTGEHKSYWSPGKGDELSAADLYRLVYGANTTSGAACEISNYIPSRAEWPRRSPVAFAIKAEQEEGVHALFDSATITVADGDPIPTVSLSEPVDFGKGFVWTANSDCDEFYICAPGEGTIATSHFACNYGATMEYHFQDADGKVWKMVVSDAKCWYCCRNKSDTDINVSWDENSHRFYYTANTNDSLKDHKCSPGTLLMVGKANTTIKFIRA